MYYVSIIAVRSRVAVQKGVQIDVRGRSLHRDRCGSGRGGSVQPCFAVQLLGNSISPSHSLPPITLHILCGLLLKALYPPTLSSTLHTIPPWLGTDLRQ